MKNTMDFYNKTTDEWSKKYNQDTEVPCLYDFLTRISKGSRILDLCCGCGYESQRMKNMGFEVVGMDFSEKSIAIARDHNPTITFYIDNILNDYSYAGKFDVIVMIAGLVHVEKSDLKLAFQQMSKVLNNDGYIFLCIFEGCGKIEKKSYCIIDQEEYDRCFIGHTLKELLLESADFLAFEEEIGIDGTPWKNYIFRKL